MPALEKLIRYSPGLKISAIRPSHELWQCELAAALDLEDLRSFPSAPVTQTGRYQKPTVEAWFHVDPIRMEMSNEGLSLQPASAWSDEQLAELCQLVTAHLRDTDVSFEVAEGRAFICESQSRSAETVSAQFAQRESLRDVLPKGHGALELQRLMTEIQMLIHDRFPDPGAANGVWLWGNGSMKTSERKLPAVYADDAFVRGICILHAERAMALPASLRNIEERGDAKVFVVREDSLAKMESNWFAPLLDDLEMRRIEVADLYLDGVNLRARFSPWRRLIAQPRPMLESLRISGFHTLSETKG